MIKIGKQYRFCYPREFTSLPDYTAHIGALVTVKREATPEESDHHDDPDLEPLYAIRAIDGWGGMAFESELEEPRSNEREKP